MIWDSLCMILIFYEIIAIPMDLSFNVTLGNNFELVVDCLFMVDILISFNTTFYDKGVVVFYFILFYINIRFMIEKK